MDDILNLMLEEIKNGYHRSDDGLRLICNICGCEFEFGEVFKIGERFFDAERAVRKHIETDHGHVLDNLTAYDKKYTGLTDHQKQLLLMISAGMTDGEIASKTQAKASTVRHQRFTFREKARQAKLYLAIYELSVRGKEQGGMNFDKKDELIDIHAGATMIDERYMITKAEEKAIVANMFSSVEPLKLKILSPKEKKKIVILKKIAGQFEYGRKYDEKEINEIIKDIYDDFATIRRYLIEYGFMERTNDCGAYWLK